MTFRPSGIADGQPVFAVVSYPDFMALYAKKDSLIPHALVSATVDGVSPIKAWCEYLGFAQAEVSRRLEMTQATFAQIETEAKPR